LRSESEQREEKREQEDYIIRYYHLVAHILANLPEEGEPISEYVSHAAVFSSLQRALYI
jgi:hypothetical protein